MHIVPLLRCLCEYVYKIRALDIYVCEESEALKQHPLYPRNIFLVYVQHKFGLVGKVFDSSTAQPGCRVRHYNDLTLE